VLIIAALAYMTNQFVNLTLEKDALDSRLANVIRFNEMREYKETVSMAPEEARRILEILDRAIVMSESDDSEGGIIGVPEPTEEAIADPATEVAQESDASTVENPEASDQANAEGQTGDTGGDPLQEAWGKWHEASGQVKKPTNLDIDDFELSNGGQVTFLLRQDGSPGQRVKGRVLVVIAVSDSDGKISLVSAPGIDLTKPEQAWELGSKYNIIASKLVRAQASIPKDSKIVNAEVSSWDEDTKELVFRKKILIEDK
jgi:hypothetical protein